MHETLVKETAFKDHFSDGSADYSQFRPVYPETLFSYLASIAPSCDLAWDCATGNGQSARMLARYFIEVIATDASANQIKNATQTPGVTYKVENAESTSIANNSIDLITVAQAVHWFDLARFTSEVMRVLKPQGVIAVWSYGMLKVDPAIDGCIDYLYGPVLDSYWPPERKTIENGYQAIAFPISEIQTTVFNMQTLWNVAELIGYLSTWSAVKRYIADKRVNPLVDVEEKLVKLWGDPQRKKLMQWPLTLKVWKNN